MSEDRLELTARRWSAEDRIVSVARRMTHRYDLDPSHVSRLESAALRDTGAEFESALADLLDAVVAADY